MKSKDGGKEDEFKKEKRNYAYSFGCNNNSFVNFGSALV